MMIFLSVFRQLSLEENYHPVRIGVWVKVRVSFRVGGQPDNCPRGKRPTWLGLGFGLGLVLGLGGAIVLEPILSTLVADVLINIKLIYCYKIQVFKCIIVDSETSRKPLISLMHNARESSDTL